MYNIIGGTPLMRTPLGPWLERCPYFREREICNKSWKYVFITVPTLYKFSPLRGEFIKVGTQSSVLINQMSLFQRFPFHCSKLFISHLYNLSFCLKCRGYSRIHSCLFIQWCGRQMATEWGDLWRPLDLQQCSTTASHCLGINKHMATRCAP